VSRDESTKGEFVETAQRKTTIFGRGGGSTLRVLGEAVSCKVTAEMTGGAYSLFEIAVPPGGGPPSHVQHHDDECLFVLEGEFEFLTDGETVRVGPGSLAYVPKGSLHAYENIGGVPGRLIAIHTPGGVHERFFEEIGGEADTAKITAAAARHGIEVPPPLEEERGRRG
jgi:mannose-6-phosphate isomerase-like protein (cupin superfamily)